MKKQGLDLSEEQLGQLQMDCDSNNDGSLTIYEFTTSLGEMYELWDAEKKDREMQAELKALGEPLDEEAHWAKVSWGGAEMRRLSPPLPSFSCSPES